MCLNKGLIFFGEVNIILHNNKLHYQSIDEDMSLFTDWLPERRALAESSSPCQKDLPPLNFNGEF